MDLKVITMLQEAFPFNKLSDEGVKLYAVELSDINPVTLRAAARNIIRTMNRMPHIAEIREEAARISSAVNGCEEEVNHAKAWELVYKAASTVGYDRGLETLPDSVRRVASSFWRDICYEPSKNLGIIRAQFRDAYNAYAEQEKLNKRTQKAIDSNAMLSAAQKQNALKLEAAVKQLAEAKAVNNDGANS